MIARLQGVISEKTPTRVVLDVSGVGYALLVPFTTYEKLGEVGEHAKLLTHLHVREDMLQLFGFSTAEEKSMFSYLISVSGIGPKLALGILSGCAVDALKLFIANSDAEALTKLPGLGKKTAQRLITELKDKFTDLSAGAAGAPSLSALPTDSRKFEEAVLALIALGYNRNLAQKQILPILNRAPDLPVDEVIKRVLQSS